MRSRALATQAKLDQVAPLSRRLSLNAILFGLTRPCDVVLQLEKQRENVAKSKASKRAQAGMLTKTDGPAAAEPKGLRMVENSSDEDDDESQPEPASKSRGLIGAGGAAGFALDRGAAVTSLSGNR